MKNTAAGFKACGCVLLFAAKLLCGQDRIRIENNFEKLARKPAAIHIILNDEQAASVRLGRGDRLIITVFLQAAALLIEIREALHNSLLLSVPQIFLQVLKIGSFLEWQHIPPLLRFQYSTEKE